MGGGRAMTRAEWRKAQVEAARNDDAVSARYRREARVDWWSVVATERRYQLRLYSWREVHGNDAAWMVPMVRHLSERARGIVRGG